MTAAPRYATARDPTRPTLGAGWADLAAALHRPLIPWQRALLDVAGELQTVEGRYRPAYHSVVIVVPRRAGKTTVALVRAVAECMEHRAHAFFTADTQTKAMKIVREEWWPVLQRARFDTTYAWRLKAGNTEGGLFRESSLPGRAWRRSGGITLFSPTPNALHGLDADLVMVDEVWSFDLLHGDALDAAIAPTAWARPRAQHWYLSAGGEPSSGWLHRKMDAGRSGVPGVCYVEFSADPDAGDYDPLDPALWAQVHPGLGYTVDRARVAADAATMDLATFERSMLCVWDRPAEMGARLVGWESLLHPSANPTGGLVVAIDVPPSRDHAAIAAADHHGAVELVEHRRGTGWLADRLAALVEAHPVERLVLDPAGPAGATVLPAGLAVTHLDTADVAQACGWLVDQIAEPGRCTIRPHPDLAAAIAGVITVEVGDGRFRWARRRTGVDLSPLYAVNLAGWSAATAPTPAIL